MKIILVTTGAKGRNVVFVSDTLEVYPLEEAVRLARAEKFENVYAVKKGSGVYLRTSRTVPKKERLEQLAVSSRQLFAYAHDTRFAVSTPALARYLQLYEHTLQKDGGPFIIIKGKVKITKAAAKMRSVIDGWKKFIDLSSKPDIIATLYSLYKDPHAHPQPSERGTQIANEFYQLAKAWLVPL